MTRLVPACLGWLVLAAAPALAAPPAPAVILRDSAEVLSELQSIPLKGIPPALIADAQAVAIIPRVLKAGFVIGGRGGHGVVLCRAADGTWGEPTFIAIGGASVGFQVGVQSTDVVLVFKSKKSLDRILEGKGKLTLGADVAVAAGPVGRQAEAGTDSRLRDEILSYSRSRGLFAGVALDGSVLTPDPDGNTAFRADKRPATAEALADLKTRLAELALDKPAPPPGVPAMPPKTVPVPPDLPK